MYIFLFVHQGNIHAATRQGNLDTVRQLIVKGTDVNVRDDNGVSSYWQKWTTPAWFLHLISGELT